MRKQQAWRLASFGRRWIGLLAVVGCVVVAGVLSFAAGSGDEGDERDLRARFTFSGTFFPSHVDTNGDGFAAESALDEIKGRLRGTGSRSVTGRGIELVRQSKMVEFVLTNPNHNCFRVKEGDFSVEENAYIGPLFELVNPIRTEPVASNPSLVPYRAENWTTFYQAETGELIYAKVHDFQICIENVPADLAPWPLCHVRWRETIVGGTGRFKDATGEVTLTAIAPTATSNAPAFDRNGNLNLILPQGLFFFGPSYGAGDMHVRLAYRRAR